MLLDAFIIQKTMDVRTARMRVDSSKSDSAVLSSSDSRRKKGPTKAALARAAPAVPPHTYHRRLNRPILTR
jgi:hypothetical protein